MAEILVIGATGTVGREVVQRLRQDGLNVAAMARNPEKAARLRESGVELITGDLTQPDSLDKALRGARKVFLLSPLHPEQVQQQRNALEAAKRAGAQQIVKVSAIGASPDSPIQLGRMHGEVDQAILQSGIPATILRPSSFYQNLLQLAPTIKAQSRFAYPFGSARVAMIDVRDIAEVAFRVFTEPGHEGNAYDLTGPAAYTMEDVAIELSKLLGRQISYTDVPVDEFRKGMEAQGLPAWHAQVLAELFNVLRQGHGEQVNNLVQELTKRPAYTLGDFLRHHLDAFGPNLQVSHEADGRNVAM